MRYDFSEMEDGSESLPEEGPSLGPWGPLEASIKLIFTLAMIICDDSIVMGGEEVRRWLW